MKQRLRWGILGTGNIARQFAAGVRASARSELAAVGSRSAEAATAFAKANDIPVAVGSYDELLHRRDVDAIYISLPNTLHHAWTIAALRAGKHVLCEKPFSVTAAESEEMFDVSDRTGRLVMEAFMYRCHPQTLAVQAAVASGVIGQVKQIRTSFCYRTSKVAGNIRFDPKLAGGALMDVGCYCLSFSRLFAGAEPVEGVATGNIHTAGVDDLCTGWLRFPGGVVASFSCGMSLQADNTATISGDDGYIEVPIPWKPKVTGAEYTIAHSAPPKQDFSTGNAPPPPPRQTLTLDAGGELYGIEADDFAASVQDGTPPRVGRQDTIGNMIWLERFRKQIGLSY